MRRHPIPIQAHFRHSLVLTFAYPEEALVPLLPPGLTLDSYEGWGFLAIALVQTENLRPAGLPAMLGSDFFLSGYRLFTRYRHSDGRSLRGLHILRSDTDSRLMEWGGNMFTRYRYRTCVARSVRLPDALEIAISTPDGDADLFVRACLDGTVEAPPAGSPFPDLKIARRYAGPLPFTFDYEPESRQMIIVEGVRSNWQPRAVAVESVRSAFLEHPPFSDYPVRLANAFLLEDIPYRWKRGVVAPLAEIVP